MYFSHSSRALHVFNPVSLIIVVYVYCGTKWYFTLHCSTVTCAHIREIYTEVRTDRNRSLHQKGRQYYLINFVPMLDNFAFNVSSTVF